MTTNGRHARLRDRVPALRRARTLYWLSRDSDERKDAFTTREKLTAWRDGFLAESWRIYRFPENRREDYLDDYHRRHRCRDLNRFNDLLEHKLAFRSLLLASGFPQAETVAVITDGLVLLDPFGPRRRYAGRDELERFLLDDGGRFVVKPEDGSRGRDVYAIEARDGRLVQHRGSTHEPFDLGALGAGCTLIERWVEQGDFWRALFPGSANSLRVLTMWTPGDAAPFIARVVQRMGTADTAPTDNWSGGGICAPVDPETGRMGVGRMHPLKGVRYREAFTHHPDTGAQIEGAVLPHWDRIRDAALGVAAVLPGLRYVGWDIFVDRTGTPIIGEGNGNSDVNLLQVHGGLLADPRIRRFYEVTNTLGSC